MDSKIYQESLKISKVGSPPGASNSFIHSIAFKAKPKTKYPINSPISFRKREDDKRRT